MKNATDTPARPPMRGRGVLVVVLVLVNSAAIWGQVGWALSHIVPKVIPDADWRIGMALALVFSMGLELTGVVLALFADSADEVGVPSGGMRFGSYAMGLASGAINLSHWGWNAAGISFALLSTLSPFLWGIRAKIARGLPVAPSRRFWHPRSSVELIREMAWRGLADESEAMRLLHPELFASQGAIEPAAVLPLPVDALVGTPAPAPAEQAEAIEVPARARAITSGSGSSAALLAVAALQDGRTTDEAVAASGLSAPAVRKYAAAIRTLKLDPSAEVRPGIRADVVGQIRDWARRENASRP